MSADYAQVEYRGVSGITLDCLRALSNLLQENIEFEEEVYLLSSPLESNGCRSHAFFLREIDNRRQYIIRVGFRSGYSGEGPKGLSSALCMLRRFGLWVKQIEVKKPTFAKIEGSGITNKELAIVLESPKYPWVEIEKYLLEDFYSIEAELQLNWTDMIIPLRIIDSKLHDLARVFWKDPDSALTKGYKRLEDIVRKRTELDDGSTTLMKKAFLGDKAVLGWKTSASESTGRANLFIGTFMAFRNPRAHKEDGGGKEEEYLAELLQLNMLYRLENEAIVLEKIESDNIVKD